MAYAAPDISNRRIAQSYNNQTEEQRYWRTFKSPVLIKEYGPINSIDFNPIKPFSDLAVTASSRVQIYNTVSLSSNPRKSLARFKDTTYSGSFRRDGNLLIAGDKSGLIQIFDLSSRAILRTWSGKEAHASLPVCVTKFHPIDLTKCFTAGDDCSVQLRDITDQTCIASFKEHNDYVRTADMIKENGVIVSGSYDGTVRLWDPRQTNRRPVSSFTLFNEGDTVQPVLSVLPLSGGTLIAAGGGRGILKIWDSVSGRSLIDLSNHQKDITCITQNSTGDRLLTGGLDGHVKIYDVSNWKVVHGIKYPGPILSLALSPSDDKLCTGMSNGLLSIRTRNKKKTQAELIDEALSQPRLTKRSYAPDYVPGNEDIVIEKKRVSSLVPFQQALKQFHYSEALDLGLRRCSDEPEMFLNLLVELQRRSALWRALDNRPDHELVQLIEWITKNVQDTKYTKISTVVTGTLLDIYGIALGQSKELNNHMQSLLNAINKEVDRSQHAWEMVGQLELLISG